MTLTLSNNIDKMDYTDNMDQAQLYRQYGSGTSYKVAGLYI